MEATPNGIALNSWNLLICPHLAPTSASSGWPPSGQPQAGGQLDMRDL